MNWDKDIFITNIRCKLEQGIKLTETEINSVISALIKAKGYTQKPFYEVIYHDEYDRREKRIMQPVFNKVIKENGYYLQKQGYELVFQRVITEEEMKENKNIHDGM